MNNLSEKIKSRFDHLAARQVLKEKYQAKMLFADQNGLWRAGPELITLLMAVGLDHLVILDLYDNPILVDRKKLLDQTITLWQEQLNAWLVELAEVNRQR